MLELLRQTLHLYLDAAPWLLLGLVVAGLIKGWTAEARIGRWLGGSGLGPVVKAALIGAPLPLCSCGVLPAALGLRRAGASRGATVSFLIATPETGVDSIALSYALLGPLFAVVRPIAAVLSAVCAGALVALVPEPGRRPAFNVVAAPVAACGCGGACGAPAVPANGWRRARDGLRYALTDILDDIAPWLAVGLLLAGGVAAFVPPLALAHWGSGVAAMLVMLLVGIPMYICATASTPLAAALLLAGVSPGTVLVFLLAGPATNIATLALVRRELGGRVMTAYLGGLAAASVGLGVATDWVVGRFDIDVVAGVGAAAEVVPAWLAWVSGGLLLLAAIKPLRRLWLR